LFAQQYSIPEQLNLLNLDNKKSEKKLIRTDVIFQIQKLFFEFHSEINKRIKKITD
jgi:hypothetical protein